MPSTLFSINRNAHSVEHLNELGITVLTVLPVCLNGINTGIECHGEYRNFIHFPLPEAFQCRIEGHLSRSHLSRLLGRDAMVRGVQII